MTTEDIHKMSDYALTSNQVICLFTLAGIQIERVWELTNLYWRDNSPRGPWFLVKSGNNLIRIGWRKRVLEIDYEATDFRGSLTSDEVTQTSTLVHAWSFGKALEYLSLLGRILEGQHNLQSVDERTKG